MEKAVVVLGARNLGGAIVDYSLARGWTAAAVARSEDTLASISERGALALAADAALADMSEIAKPVAFLLEQGPRGMTHELVVTPAGDRWVP